MLASMNILGEIARAFGDQPINSSTAIGNRLVAKSQGTSL